MSNDISTDVQYIWTINRSSGLQYYSSESFGGKQKHVENDGHLNKLFLLLWRMVFEEKSERT